MVSCFWFFISSLHDSGAQSAPELVSVLLRLVGVLWCSTSLFSRFFFLVYVGVAKGGARMVAPFSFLATVQQVCHFSSRPCYGTASVSFFISSLLCSNFISLCFCFLSCGHCVVVKQVAKHQAHLHPFFAVAEPRS